VPDAQPTVLSKHY